MPKIDKYDFNTIEGIMSINLSDIRASTKADDSNRKKNVDESLEASVDLSEEVSYTVTFPSYVDRIEYILQRKATEHKKNGRMDLAIACLRKSNELIMQGDSFIDVKALMRLVEFLKIDRKFNEAREEDVNIKAFLQESNPHLDNFKRTLESAKFFESDLLEMSSHGSTCSECSKYQGRVYSISGNDKRFPKLPDSFFLYGGLHEGCSHHFHVYFDFSEKTVNGENAIEFSNRPFVDVRTDEEKQNYERNALERKTYERDKLEYDLLREFLPEVAPKAFNSYRRMKSQKTKNYSKIVDAANRKGIKLL